jgi:hypothetical protein
MKIAHPGDEFTGWADDNPYFLVINTIEPQQSNIIDLGEPGWMSEREGLMREPGEWLLVAKRDNILSWDTGIPVLVIRVLEGEQPYYVKRTYGRLDIGQFYVYGIGKKRLDGHVDRLWILPPRGIICAGDDVDIIGANILKSMAL